MNEGKKDRRDPIRTIKTKNPVAKAHQTLGTGSGAHKDKKKAMKQGDVKHKNKEYMESLYVKLKEYQDRMAGVGMGDYSPNEESDNPEYSDEAGMSHGSLHTIQRAAKGLMDVIEHGDDLPEWCQEKISLAEDYLVTVWDYIQSEKEQGIDPEITESGLQYYTGVKKHGKEYMVKAAQAARKGASQAELGALKDKYSKAYKKEGVAGAQTELDRYPYLSSIKKPSWFDPDNLAGLKRLQGQLEWKMNSGEASQEERNAYFELLKFIKVKEYGEDRIKEFAPAGSDGGNTPRGPRTPGGNSWGGNDGPRDDPYGRPNPKHYGRSIDFFGKFEADHFDKENFNKKTGEFKGYWDYDGELKQIAYFKFDNPTKVGSDDSGMGWYYEPQDESVAEGKIKGVDGKACWKGKRYAGKVKKADGTYKDKCIPVGEGWTHDSLAAELFETENTYEQYLANRLKEKLQKK